MPCCMNFNNMALLLIVQAQKELQHLLEQLLNASATGVVALDQRLELPGEVGQCTVKADRQIESKSN